MDIEIVAHHQCTSDAHPPGYWASLFRKRVLGFFNNRTHFSWRNFILSTNHGSSDVNIHALFGLVSVNILYHFYVNFWYPFDTVPNPVVPDCLSSTIIKPKPRRTKPPPSTQVVFCRALYFCTKGSSDMVFSASTFYTCFSHVSSPTLKTEQ